MARNVEIKARIESVETIAAKVAAIADQGPFDIPQDDAFFACERGRLKLRAFSATEGQLIFYQRANQAGPKESFFVISPTASPDSLREALSLAYGQAGRVRKRRVLYLVGRTRVHLDRVENLGDFLELDVPRTFDVVLALGLFDYFKDPAPAARWMRAHCASTLVATFTRWDWVKAPIRHLHYDVLNRCRTFDYTEERAQAMLTGAGFSSVQVAVRGPRGFFVLATP